MQVTGWLDRGVFFGGLAVLAFTFTVHSSRAAVLGFGDVITGLGRGEIAAFLAAAVLLIMRAPWPTPGLLFRLFLVGLTSFAGYADAKKQMTDGFGGMLSVRAKGGERGEERRIGNDRRDDHAELVETEGHEVDPCGAGQRGV